MGKFGKSGRWQIISKRCCRCTANPSDIYTFVDMHAYSVCRPFFGINMTGFAL
jgi:hypothetical protein